MSKKFFYWYRKYVPQSIQKFLKSIKPKWFDYLKLDYNYFDLHFEKNYQQKLALIN